MLEHSHYTHEVFGIDDMLLLRLQGQNNYADPGTKPLIYPINIYECYDLFQVKFRFILPIIWVLT